MVEHIGQRIKQIADSKGVSVKELSAKSSKTNSAIYDIFKKKDVSSEILREFAGILEVPVSTLIGETEEAEETKSIQTATGTGNIAGDSNKQKVHLGMKVPGRQEVYGRRIDDILMDLLKCEKERDVLKTELSGVKSLLAAKEEMIQVLRQR